MPRRPLLPLSFLATIAVLACLASTACGATSIQPPLRVDGTVLRDSTGGRVGLTGIAVQMVPFYAGATPSTQDSFLAQVTARNYNQRDAEFTVLQSLGYDAIRVHIPGPSVYASELYETKAVSIARIQNIVASAHAHGLVTILDPDAIGNTLANWRDYKPMYADLVAALGNDPWVVWELFNEPADYSNGAPIYRAGIKGMGAYLRSLGSTQPIVVPSNGYEQDVSRASMDDILADAAQNHWRGAGILFGVHPYLDQYVGAPGNQGDVFDGATQVFAQLDRQIAQNLGSYPLIVTEMGRYNNGITTTNATREAYRWVASLGARGLNGFIPWDWDWALNASATDPNAWTWDGIHLNPWGQQSNDEALSKIRYPELSPPSTSATPSTATAPTATPTPPTSGPATAVPSPSSVATSATRAPVPASGPAPSPSATATSTATPTPTPATTVANPAKAKTTPAVAQVASASGHGTLSPDRRHARARREHGRHGSCHVRATHSARRRGSRSPRRDRSKFSCVSRPRGRG